MDEGVRLPPADELGAWGQRAQQAEAEKERVARAATGTTWKLRHEVNKLSEQVRRLHHENEQLRAQLAAAR